jgi:hypothetical protein
MYSSSCTFASETISHLLFSPHNSTFRFGEDTRDLEACKLTLKEVTFPKFEKIKRVDSKLFERSFAHLAKNRG